MRNDQYQRNFTISRVIPLAYLIIIVLLFHGCTPTDDYRLVTKEDGVTYVISQRPIGDQDALIAQLKEQTSTLKVYPFASTIQHGIHKDIHVLIRNTLEHPTLFSITLECKDNSGTPEDFDVKNVYARLAAGDVGHIPIGIKASATDIGIYDCILRVQTDDGEFARERLFIQVT